MAVYRVYVEKKSPYDMEAKGLLSEFNELLGISSVTGVRLLNRYDVEGIDKTVFTQCIKTVFSEPQLDNTYEIIPHQSDCVVFATEYLPGQFDQRAQAASECIQLITQGQRPLVHSAKVYILSGNILDKDIEEIKKYVINPVEAREASLDEKDTLKAHYPEPEDVKVLEGFLSLTRADLNEFVSDYGLAMDLDDITFCQNYFKTEHRDPTLTEIRMIDTYWSDHCRHTTFNTIIDGADIEDSRVQKAYNNYIHIREELGRTKPITLMDLGTIGAKYLKKTGQLKNLDESDEINACSVKIHVDTVNGEEEWLLLFKNETHNHPTEIEPFGGAATCIGGAIRDPLANRGYVYQAMRVTGAANPLLPLSETISGKLPQRKIVTTAAAGYSSYGNQIGLATGQVDEIYHPGYVAKRMEIGAVVGAVPLADVRRDVPEQGDVVVLIGGKTGRDGCGGATGSSKAHKVESLASCGAEVQKGNAPEERKLQRLFRNPNATLLIKRCNDFGAGGVSVAIGELADGLIIDLNKVPKKYEGLDGTELAISESQERMAVVLDPKDVDKFLSLATEENLEATVVAEITKEPRLVMNWNGRTIVDINREFLNSNGAEKHADVKVPVLEDAYKEVRGNTLEDKLMSLVSDLNICSKKGLSERFDSTIGAGTVTMPFGGKHQMTPAQAMVAKIPVKQGETSTCSGMAYGYNPFISEKDPYTGAYLAVLESVCKLVSAGFDNDKMYLTFQEYFERLYNDNTRWGKPFAALLGALDAQLELGIASIGGKDSMSGTFEDIDVPPTLVSFAVASGNANSVVSPEFKRSGSKVVVISPEMNGLIPDTNSLKSIFKTVQELISSGDALSVWSVGYGGIAEALFKMGLGNRIGISFDKNYDQNNMFDYAYGSFVVELASDKGIGEVIGTTNDSYTFELESESISLENLQKEYEKVLEPVYPYRTLITDAKLDTISYKPENIVRCSPKIGIKKPHALVPVFPGTNCEYDTAMALERVGIEAEVVVIKNLSSNHVTESVDRICKSIADSQMIVLPGGFSGGDEPDGSGKFITAVFRNPRVKNAVNELLKNRDGLMLGICNGFQALIKLGLIEHGEITDTDENSPTLTYNTISRHQSMLVNTRIASVKSPWLSQCQVGDQHVIAISHGEGRFVANDDVIKQMIDNGQIATQYVNLSGDPTMDIRYNPNGSLLAIEGLTSPDGRILGKMGHSERSGDNLYKNVPGNKYQPLFEGGANYFKL